MCEFIFVILHKLYCAASTFPPLPPGYPCSPCYCCSLARRIHCKLLFLLIFAHIFISILFLALANELCAMQQAVPELGVAASPHSLLLSRRPLVVCLCHFCGKLRVVCPAAVLHPFNPFSSLSPSVPFGVPLLTLETGVA